jgi:hypothetical protein
MMAVGIEADPIDITYAPAPGDTRSGFVPKKRQKTTSPLATTVWLQRERAVPEGDRLTKTPTHHDPVFMLRECQCAQSLLRAGRAGMMSPPSGVV